MMISGLAVTVILGVAGLGIDVASWELALRNMQGVSHPARGGGATTIVK